MKRKIKILRTTGQDSCYECEGKSYLYPVTTDWEEVDNEEYHRVRMNLYKANENNRRGDEVGYYILVSYSEEITLDFFKDVEDFNKKIEAEETKREKAKANVKKKREATALERKRKQLAKLKKELGD